MSTRLVLHGDIQFEVFRQCAIQEAWDGFQQPLLLSRLRIEHQQDPENRGYQELYQEVLRAYRHASIPITVNNLVAFNAVRNLRDWVHSITLIFANCNIDRNYLSLSGIGFKLKSSNDLQRITLDLTGLLPTAHRKLWYESMIKLLIDASRVTMVYPYTRNATVRKVSVLVNPSLAYQEITNKCISDFSRMFSFEPKIVDITPALSKLEWEGDPAAIGESVRNYRYRISRCVVVPVLASKYSQAPLVQDPILSDFTIYQSEVSPSYSIRVKRQNATLCDTPVNQYTGWLDIGQKHFFFWYFKAENTAPKRDGSEPLALWLAGGPGVSSMLSLFQELGPCLVNEHGNGTVNNPFGWNKETALIFVDQPAGVGFSYVDEGEHVPGDSFTSAADMHLFLQIFMGQVFPEHKNGPLVITGESYAQPQVSLKSLAIGNGLVSPLDRAYGYWETLCTTNPGVKEPVFNETICDIMATNLPRCMEVAKVCYDHPDPAICQTAETVCWDGVINFYDSQAHAGGRNRFDITAPCEIDDFCYADMKLVGDYLNLSSSFSALGVPKVIKKFEVSSQAVDDAFQLTNDGGITMMPQLEYLLANQIDILIYQGNLDLACNTAGAKRWTANMPWKGQSAFTSKELKPWKSTKNGKDVVAGTFKEVNIKMVEGDEKTTRFSLVTIDNSGHMVPMDQPEIALDMLNRWLAGDKFD
ncbi:hypothetical protein EG329_012165 [Mollisiaceae sp. DMI_Dod_QoI]|nr:hypothetical protein EG329_012165 [Helotiales sp. DMI_Dod_QoI]